MGLLARSILAPPASQPADRPTKRPRVSGEIGREIAAAGWRGLLGSARLAPLGRQRAHARLEAGEFGGKSALKSALLVLVVVAVEHADCWPRSLRQRSWLRKPQSHSWVLKVGGEMDDN